MLSMDIRNVVCTLVKQLLIESGGRKDEVLQFSFDCGLGYYKDNITLDVRRGLHLLYYLPPQRSYVTVFSSVTSSPFIKARNIPEWKHECTHDTCWRDINVFGETYFDMASEINLSLEKAGYPKVAPITMVEYNSFPTFEKPWQWMPAKVITDPTCDRNYRKLVTLGDSV